MKRIKRLYKKEKIKVNVEYISEKQIGVSKSSGTAERIQQIKKKIKDLKTTNVYQILAAKRVTLVKSPIKMTNVLLKNVHFQYALKLWNYLRNYIRFIARAEKNGR